MGQRLPDKAANLLAVAELLKNPDKVQEVAEQIRAETAALDAAYERNQVSVEERQKFDADKDQLEREKIELAEMLKVQRENEDAVAKMVSDVAEREKKAASDNSKLADLTEQLAQRERMLDNKEEDLAEREKEVLAKEVELDNALKAAQAEHDMWKQRNAKLQAAVA